DAPSRETCQVKRARTNTPLQALELLNDVTYVEAARRVAELALAAPSRSDEERIGLAFRRATARTPSSAELSILRRGLERYRASYQARRGPAQRVVPRGGAPPGPGTEPRGAGRVHRAGERHSQS